MDNQSILLGLVGLFGVGTYFFYGKFQGAKALNSNIETQKQVFDLQKDVNVEQAKVTVETQKQEDLQKDLEVNKNKDLSNEDLKDFFMRELNNNDHK